MISTVTTSTVSTVTSVTLAASFTLFVVVLLLALLIQKELLTVLQGARALALKRALDFALVPLLLSFAFIAVVKVAQVLR